MYYYTKTIFYSQFFQINFNLKNYSDKTKKAPQCDRASTGSVTGNIVGAYLGLVKSDSRGDYFTKIEAYDTILEIAEDLTKTVLANDVCDITDAKWYAKYIYIYIYCTYMKDNNEENEEINQLKYSLPGMLYKIHEMEKMLGDDGYWDDEDN